MKRVLIVILLFSMVITGCSNNQESGAVGEEEKAAAGQSKEEITYVKVSPVETMDFANKLSLPGTLQPKEEVLVTAKVNGTAGNITVDVGSKVNKGDTLSKIDDTIFRLQYEKAAKALELESLRAEKAEKALRIAQIKFDNLEKNYYRTKALFQSQAISQAEMDNMETQFQIEKEALELAKNDYNMAEGLLALAQNDYQLAKENLDYTYIRSPITGIVSMKDVFNGENIGPGKAIFGIINTDEMYVETGVSEKNIALISLGQKVYARVDALSGKSYEGVVTHVGPMPHPQSKTYPVKVLLKNQDAVLKVGMFATVEIIMESKNNALSVLKEAVMLENGSTYVFVEENGKAVRKEVKLGFVNDTHHEIATGIQEGENVIIVGQNTLVNGSDVKVIR